MPEDETYKGVSIAIEPANLATNDTGYFSLQWPGHHEERVKSQHRQAKYIMLEARSFVDSWIADGYIKLPDMPEDKLALLQDGDFVEHRGLDKVERLGPITIKDGHVLCQSQKFKGLTISIQQHRILAIIRNGETIHRFD